MIVIGLVVLLLGSMAVLSKQEPPKEEDPIWTIIRPPSDVTSMVDAGDIIWVGGKDGVIGVNEDTHELIDFPCEQRLTYTRNMLWEDGVLWIGHDRGLTRWTEDDWYTYTEDDGMVTDRVNWIMRDMDGVLWAGTWHGAYFDDGSGWGKITTEDGLLNHNVNTITQHSNGDLWFGSYTTPDGGISVLTDDGWMYFSTENGLIHNNIVQFFEDTDGAMWASTGLMTVGAGVRFELIEGEWAIEQLLTSEDGIPEGKVRSIFRDSGDVLWVGTEDLGMALMDDMGVRIISTASGLSNDEVKVYFEDRYENLWLGTRDGITVLTREDITNIK
jgi:ligand-binding sensor domain-containing protein